MRIEEIQEALEAALSKLPEKFTSTEAANKAGLPMKYVRAGHVRWGLQRLKCEQTKSREGYFWSRPKAGDV